MIKFSKYIWLYFIFSAIVILPGLYSLMRYGLRPSIDFSGGTLVEVKAEKSIEQSAFTKAAQEQQVEIASIQKSGESSYLLRMKPDVSINLDALVEHVASSSATAVAVVRRESVGPVLGSELLQKATYAAIAAITFILLYIAYAFKNVRYGVSAVVALVHDLLVVVGIFSLLGHFYAVEVDTLFVTAFLTTMSFSVHDTIVVFDRIREYLKKNKTHTFEEISNIALSETMNRSLTNSFTIIFMLLALILMGGETIRWFVVALLIGTISGTYSSPFVATPVLVLWERLARRKRSASRSF